MKLRMSEWKLSADCVVGSGQEIVSRHNSHSLEIFNNRPAAITTHTRAIERSISLTRLYRPTRCVRPSSSPGSRLTFLHGPKMLQYASSVMQYIGLHSDFFASLRWMRGSSCAVSDRLHQRREQILWEETDHPYHLFRSDIV